jgi:hypothetical protein
VRKPVTTWLEYFRQHRDRDRQLKTYITTGRGRKTCQQTIIDELKETSSRSLFATNRIARLSFGRWLRRSVGQSDLGAGYFFVTLAPRCFAVPLSEAPAFNHEQVKVWVQTSLADFDFVGMVDFALYTNLKAAGGLHEFCVSVHWHGVVWGCSLSDLETVKDDINAGHRTLIPGYDAAHVRLLSREQMNGRILYLSKAPLSEYRVYPRKTEVMDKQTGELTKVSLGSFQQRKRLLRPGDAVRMCQVLAGRTLPELALANGEGDRILARAIRMCVLELKQREERRLEIVEKLTGSRPDQTKVTVG